MSSRLMFSRLLPLCLSLSSVSVWASEPVRVLSVVPQGEVAELKQVTARFSADMIKRGDRGLRNPFVVDCKGQGIWANPRTWVYTVATPLKAAQACKLELAKGLQAVSGEVVKPVLPVTVRQASKAPAGAAAVGNGRAVLQLFSPQGETRTVRQVQARFSEAMVRFGDPKVYNPFGIKCAAKGRGRWVDTRNWVYDFEQDLPAGLACDFTVVAGLRAVSGAPFSGVTKYSFNTGGPSVVDVRPYRDDRDIDENQTFLLKFDGALDRFSLPQSSYCLIEGLKERVPVRYLSTPETQSLAAALPEEVKSWWQEREAHTDFGPKPVAEWRALNCARALPPASRVSLVFAPELSSATGVKSTQEQRLEFRVRSAFNATFNCTRENARQACAPVADMTLSFSSTVSAEKLAAITLEQGSQRWRPEPNAEGGGYQSGESLTFKGPFPAEAAFLLRLPVGFADDSGRPLANAARFPLAVKTAAFPPLVKFAAPFGIVEAAAGAVPLTVRNLEPGKGVRTEARLFSYQLPDSDAELLRWLERFKDHQSNQNCPGCVERNDQGEPIGVDPRSQSLLRKVAGITQQPLPKQLGPKEFEVLGLPLKSKGVYLHEVESRYLGESLIYNQKPMYVSAMSVVTNLGVHLKRGAQNSLVWVTTLDQAQPVAGAEVGVWECKTQRQVWSGKTDAQGLARIDRELNLGEWGDCMSSKYVVIARHAGDRGLVLPNWTEGIEAWRFNLPWSSNNSGRVLGHSVLDRSLFRAGETVHMRHVLRELTLAGLRSPTGESYKKLSIVHDGSEQEYELPINIDRAGNGESTWDIPVAAKLGSYRIQLQTKESYLTLGTFRVAEFRLPVLKARLQLPAAPQVAVNQIPVDMQLHYANGGAYSGAPVSTRGRISPASLHFPDFSEFRFGVDEEEAQGQDIAHKSYTLDRQGGLRVNEALPKITRPSQLDLEMEFRDPSGETQTVASRATLWPAAVLPGIRVPYWAQATGDAPLPVDIITLGTNGRPRAGVAVQVTAALHSEQTHRKRTVGGFYAYESIRKQTAVPVNCAGKSDAQGRFSCQIKAAVSGELHLTVSARDEAGRSQQAQASVWIAGGERWWFSQDNHDRIDLIPEAKQYEPGQDMRFQVRMPFAEATALVTVERDGIIDAFVQRLSSKNATLTLPAKAEYAPNVYVSALVLRGRNNAVAPTALVDLGKPAFKLGLAPVRVGWAAYTLGVDVKTDKARYQPREKAQVSVQVRPPQGQALPAGTQVTLAAVDEALLELADNTSWDLLPAMMASRGHDIDTATSQLQVVGKRHFGRKAVAPGGGGGQGLNTRELFDTLLFWKGSAAVDAQGRAQFTVPLNDSLTGFKIVAVASSENRFGKGEASIQSRQDVQLISGLPLLVRQGDKLDPGFTLRNSSDQVQELRFRAEAEGLGVLKEESLSLQPGEAREIKVSLSVPLNITELRWNLSAVGAKVADRVKLTQKVLDAVPERVLQATLFQLEAPQTIPVQKPQGALPGGALMIAGQARLADSLGTVTDWFKNYPYACLEQKTSKAVGTQDPKLWADIMQMLPVYLDDNGLAAFYPGSRGYPFLTAHILNLAHAIGWDIPEASRTRMLKALGDYADGRLSFDDWVYSPLDDTQRRLEVLTVLAKYGELRTEQLDSLRIDPPRWTTRMQLDWLELVQAAKSLPQREQRLAQAQSLLRSRLTLQGSMLLLSDGEYSHWWLYDNHNVTLARIILATRNLPEWREDQSRLLRGLTQYQDEGRWDTTLANLWGGIALRRFSEQFEREAVSGRTVATLGAQKAELVWSSPKPEAQRLSWPDGSATLAVVQEGTGKPWITVQSRARLPLSAPLSTGFNVKKEIKALQQKQPGQWSVGDVVRVRLSLESQSDIGWVVVDDPIPAGATLLGRALARDSSLLTQGEDSDWVWPTFAEFAADAYRAYYERIYKGDWVVEYTLRLNQSGAFKLPATRVEAMYAPEMFGMTPNADWVVKP